MLQVTFVSYLVTINVIFDEYCAAFKVVALFRDDCFYALTGCNEFGFVICANHTPAGG